MGEKVCRAVAVALSRRKSAAAEAPYCMPFAFSMASSMVPTM